MFMCIYRPHALNKQYFLENASMVVDHSISIRENLAILGDLNRVPNSHILALFMHSLLSLCILS